MAEVNPPSWLRDGCHTAEGDRQIFSALVCTEGVSDVLDGSLQVTDGAAGLQVNVAAGRAFIQGDSVSDQGMYVVYNDATEVLTATTANPTNPRIDLVVARVRDSQYTGSDDDWILEIVAGTPAASPVAPALPSTAIALAQISVLAGATTLAAGDITDLRDPFQLCTDEAFLSIYRSTAISRAAGVESVVNWNATEEATNTTLTSTNRMAGPAGLYTVSTFIKYDGATGESTFLTLRKNSADNPAGGTELTSWRCLNPDTDSSRDRSVGGSKTVRLADGEYLQVFWGNQSGSSGTVTSATGLSSIYFTMVRTGN